MTGKTAPRMLRNYQIAPGLQRFSKARMFHAKGLWIKLNKPFQKKMKLVKEAENFVVNKIGGEKNGGERKVLKRKEPKLLPQVPTIQTKAKNRSKKVPLRKSITPGTILIILAGRHRGKRVIFIKQLPKSGLLLVTGPLKLNATPLRRIAQAFVIATKTNLDISSVSVPEHLDDNYFKRRSNKAADKSKGGIFAEGTKQQYFVTDQRKEDQKSMDSQVLEVIRKHPEKKFLFGYLGSRFHLSKGIHPHKMFTKWNGNSGFVAGDVVGCGVDLEVAKSFTQRTEIRGHNVEIFSKRGINLSELFPCVSLLVKGDKSEANFGPNFKYKF